MNPEPLTVTLLVGTVLGPCWWMTVRTDSITGRSRLTADSLHRQSAWLAATAIAATSCWLVCSGVGPDIASRCLWSALLGAFAATPWIIALRIACCR